MDKTQEGIVNSLNPAHQAMEAIDKGKQAVSSAVNSVKNAWNSSPLHQALAGNPGPTTYKYDENALKAKPAPKTPAKKSGKTPSYKHGTDYVPKTGKAHLHEGEAVLPKHEADAYRAMKGAHEALGGDTKPAKTIKHIVTKKAKNGGYIHEHHHTHPEHHPMEEHVSANQDQMVSHMMDHMGEPNPGEAEADAGQSGIPQGGPAAQVPPAGMGGM